MELFRELIALSLIMHHDAVSRAAELSVDAGLSGAEQLDYDLISLVYGKRVATQVSKKTVGLASNTQ